MAWQYINGVPNDQALKAAGLLAGGAAAVGGVGYGLGKMVDASNKKKKLVDAKIMGMLEDVRVKQHAESKEFKKALNGYSIEDLRKFAEEEKRKVEKNRGRKYRFENTQERNRLLSEKRETNKKLKAFREELEIKELAEKEANKKIKDTERTRRILAGEDDVKKRTPAWIRNRDNPADNAEMKRIKAEATALGQDVDHGLARRGKFVSGLDVPTNMMPMDPHQNRHVKGNKIPGDFGEWEWKLENGRLNGYRKGPGGMLTPVPRSQGGYIHIAREADERKVTPGTKRVMPGKRYSGGVPAGAQYRKRIDGIVKGGMSAKEMRGLGFDIEDGKEWFDKDGELRFSDVDANKVSVDDKPGKMSYKDLWMDDKIPTKAHNMPWVSELSEGYGANNPDGKPVKDSRAITRIGNRLEDRKMGAFMGEDSHKNYLANMKGKDTGGMLGSGYRNKYVRDMTQMNNIVDNSGMLSDAEVKDLHTRAIEPLTKPTVPEVPDSAEAKFKAMAEKEGGLQPKERRKMLTSKGWVPQYYEPTGTVMNQAGHKVDPRWLKNAKAIGKGGLLGVAEVGLNYALPEANPMGQKTLGDWSDSSKWWGGRQEHAKGTKEWRRENLESLGRFGFDMVADTVKTGLGAAEMLGNKMGTGNLGSMLYDAIHNKNASIKKGRGLGGRLGSSRRIKGLISGS